MIVVTAFDRNEEGILIPTYKPEPPETEELAIELAKSMADRHAGVIAWLSPAGDAVGVEDTKVFFQSGEVPEME